MANQPQAGSNNRGKWWWMLATINIGKIDNKPLPGEFSGNTNFYAFDSSAPGTGSFTCPQNY